MSGTQLKSHKLVEGLDSLSLPSDCFRKNIRERFSGFLELNSLHAMDPSVSLSFHHRN